MPLVAPPALRVTNWTSRTLPAIRNWAGVGWGTGENWAVLPSSNTTGAYTTNNGQTWSTNTIASGGWSCIATDPTNNVMVTSNLTSNTTTLLRSTDSGVTWSTTTVPASGTNIQYSHVAFGGGAFVVIRGGGSVNTNGAIYSTDQGVTWSTAALSATQNWQAVCHDGTRFIAVGALHGGTGTSNANSLSTDGGATWSAGGTFTVAAQWLGVAAGNGTIVATNTGSTANYSTNGGSSWTATTLPFSGCYAIIFGGGIFVAVNTTGTSSAWSVDGITWTSSLTMPTSKTYVRMATSGANFLTASWSGNDTVAAMLSLTSAKSSPVVQAVTRAAVF